LDSGTCQASFGERSIRISVVNGRLVGLKTMAPVPPLWHVSVMPDMPTVKHTRTHTHTHTPGNSFSKAVEFSGCSGCQWTVSILAACSTIRVLERRVPMDKLFQTCPAFMHSCIHSCMHSFIHACIVLYCIVWKAFIPTLQQRMGLVKRTCASQNTSRSSVSRTLDTCQSS